jgi:hypothetical protein
MGNIPMVIFIKDFIVTERQKYEIIVSENEHLLKTFDNHGIIVNENHYHSHSPKVVLHMLSLFIILTIAGYSLLAKYVLNHVAKPSNTK